MIRQIRNKFDKWNDILDSCPKCRASTKERITDSIDYTTCEAEVYCPNCKIQVNYWAYGNFEGPTTRTEAVHCWFLRIRYRIFDILRTK